MAVLQRTRDDALSNTRDAAEAAATRARDVGSDLGDQARRAAVEAVDSLGDAVEPVWRQLAGTVKNLVQALLRVVAVLPSIAAKVLAVVAQILHLLGDRSAALAQVPTKADTRSSKRRGNLLWFGLGVVAGTAAGVAIGRATAPAQPDNVHHLDANRAG